MSELRLPPGTPLNGGRYRVEGTLGEGGFGITYLCQEPSLARQVAIKEYFPVGAERHQGRLAAGRLASDELAAGLRRFEQEARRLAGLDHPNIVRVAGLFEERQTFYLVTEYVEGEVLSAHHRDWLTPIVSALECVHASGLVHGDIKPENILIQPSGRPVLIDFGCSRPSHSLPTSTIVSHGFSPPEQYAGSALTPASDQYALAATWLSLTQGTPPPSAVDRLQGKPLPQLSAALARALSLDPESRWPDLPSFLAAMEGVAEPLLVQPARTGGWIRALASWDGWLASGGEDRQVRLGRSDRQPVVLGQHDGWVTGVLFCGDQLYSVGTDRFLQQWDVISGRLVGRLKLSGTPQCLVAHGGQLLVGDDKGRIHRIESMRFLSQWQAAPSAITAVAVCPGVIACNGDGQRIPLWNLGTESLVERLKGHTGTVRALCSYADHLYSGGQDRQLLGWDWREGRPTLLGNAQGTIWCLASDSRGLVSAGGDKLVRGPGGVLGEHNGEVRCLALGPGWVAAAGQDGQIRLHPWSG